MDVSIRSPRVSVVIPAYNQAQFLEQAITSVLSQTWRDLEVIVVDDGSTDNSGEVAAGFGSQIRYIWQENQGLGGARNTGIRAAQGEFIGLLDSDDQWQPSFLETMVSLADRYPQASIYYCCAQSMSVEGWELPQVFGGPPVYVEKVHQALLRANFLIPSTILMRRSIVVAAGLFDQSLRSCEDWDLWLRLVPAHYFVGTPVCLVRYRVHDSSLSTNLAGMRQATRAVIEKHFGADDEECESWPADKRRAYGGLHRYYLLTSVQRQRDWDAGAQYLRRALQADPMLSEDLDLFYELALGSQPPGHRGTAHQLALRNNAQQIRSMLEAVFDADPGLESLRRQAYGTAHFGLGLLAYNTGHIALSLSFLLKALYYQPHLWQDARLRGNLVKSFAHPIRYLLFTSKT